jgi:hypothetical protein
MHRISIGLILLSLCGCSILDTKAERGYSENRDWSISAAYTTADVRIVLQRNHPLLKNPIVCVEPSPDVADALSSAAAATVSGGNTTVNGSLSLSGSASDAVTELAGRSTALLGLRDGLFEACVAYANGAIGEDTYSLIISRYSQLMTTLFLGQDITSAAVGLGHAEANSTAPALPAADTSRTTPPPATPGVHADAEPSPNQPSNLIASAKLPLEQRPVSTTGQPIPEFIPLSVSAPVLDTTGAGATPPPIPPAPVQAPAPAPVVAANQTPPSQNTPSQNTPSQNTPTAPASGNGASTVDALALTRMNEDFMHQGLVSALIVACVNEYDPTRLSMIQPLPAASSSGSFDADHPPQSATEADPTTPRVIAPNSWLAPICESLKAKGALEALYEAEAPYDYKPVDPAIAAEQGTAKTNAPAGGAKAPADATIKAVQAALTKAGYSPGKTDGIAGPQTLAAIKTYETVYGLVPSSDPKDPDLLKSLGVAAAR